MSLARGHFGLLQAATGNAEHITYLSRIAALGGSLTAPEEALTLALIQQIQAASYGSKIRYLLPFVGAGIAANRVPLRDSFGVGAATLIGGTPLTDANCDTATGLVNSTEQAGCLNTLVSPLNFGSGAQNIGFGFWERNWGAGTGVEPMGCYEASNGNNRWCLDLRASFERFRAGNVTNSQAGPASTASSAHYYGQRFSSTLRRIFKNGTTLGSDGTTLDIIAAVGDEVYVMGCNQNGASVTYWKGRCAVAYITDGSLADADVAALHTLLDTYLVTPTGR